MIDLSHIPSRHDAVNIRLEQWGAWVKVTVRPWKTASIWRQYRPPRQYAYETQDIPAPVNTLETWEIEKIVSSLPLKHRDALRYCYVWPFVPVGKVRRELGVTLDALAGLINDSRDMVKSQLKAKTNV